MATSDYSLEWFLARTSETTPDELSTPGQGEWGRLSRDAFIANRMVNARAQHSEGDLRLSGVGVEMNSAELTAVGAIATAWQKAVSAAGAALEQVKSLRGSLPADVVQRTILTLNASPQPGSIVLHLEPKASPLLEAEPNGDVPMVDAVRPLADRASETLIELLEQATTTDITETERLSENLKSLGPRVGSAVASLAQILERSNITLDASWEEPETPTVRASVTPTTAKWISQFVAGRGLDSEVQEISGVLRTISDRERWLVEVAEDELRMDAGELDPSIAASWHVGDTVTLTVRVAITERPDGSTRTSRRILAVDSSADQG